MLEDARFRRVAKKLKETNGSPIKLFVEAHFIRERSSMKRRLLISARLYLPKVFRQAASTACRILTSSYTVLETQCYVLFQRVHPKFWSSHSRWFGWNDRKSSLRSALHWICTWTADSMKSNRSPSWSGNHQTIWTTKSKNWSRRV